MMKKESTVSRGSVMKAKNVVSDDTLMTVNELAAYLRCHIVSIYRLLKRKKIPAFKVGSDWRFSRREIDAWMSGPYETRRRRTKKPLPLESQVPASQAK
jgi:excisionase family DNA binding protein